MRILSTALIVALSLLIPRNSTANTIFLEAQPGAAISGSGLPDVTFTFATFQFDGTLQSFSLIDTQSYYQYGGHFEMVIGWDGPEGGGSGRFAGNMTLEFNLCEDELYEQQGFDCDYFGSFGFGSAQMSGQLEPDLAAALSLGCCGADADAFFLFDQVSGNPWSDARYGGTVFSYVDLAFPTLHVDGDTFLFIDGPAPSVPEPSVALMLVPAMFAALRRRYR